MVYHPVLLQQRRAKDGNKPTTQYRHVSAIHAYLLYVSCILFTSGEMEIYGERALCFGMPEVVICRSAL